MELISEFTNRNTLLFYFGCICLMGSIITAIMIITTNTEVLGINAWIKPLKFFLSTTIFVWSMAWYTDLLDQTTVVKSYSWVVIVTLSFELIYISYQAARGELSHFNSTTPFHAMMFRLMGLAITIMTIFTLVIGILFFINDFPSQPTSYIWGIRLGILLFVIFAFEGGLMAARMSHTVGSPDGGIGLPLLNWSIKYGDLRIAHFVGMHALQVLPIIGYYVIHSSRSIIIISLFYFLIALFIMYQALKGLPLFSIN